jgi:hypothetical protein
MANDPLFQLKKVRHHFFQLAIWAKALENFNMTNLWVFFFILATPCFASNLSTGMNSAEVDQVVEKLGQGAASKLLRSAESYPVFFPGVKISVEINTLYAKDLDTFGNANGTVGGLIPVPRLNLAKSLILNLEWIFNYFPGATSSSISGWGSIIKWNFFQDKSKYLDGALYVGYTKVDGANGDYSGSDYEGGIYFSRDYVKYRPYVGLGVLMAKGEVTSGLVRAGASNVSTQSTLHAFLGSEMVLPVLTLAGQLDMFNLSPRVSVSIGKKF